MTHITPDRLDALWKQAFDETHDGGKTSHRFAALLFAEQQEPLAWPIDGDTAKRIADKACVSYETVQQVARELAAPQPAPVAEPRKQEPVGEAHLVAGFEGAYTQCVWDIRHVPVGTKLYTSPQPAQLDLPDFIAGALGVSRGTAYDMMREALKEKNCD